jgi:perosamine synthetase
MNFIAVNEPLLNGNEKKYLNECIDSGWISSEGPFVKKLENDFSKYCGQSYGVAVANGSVAIDVAIRALKEVYNFSDGDEIIMPSFTIISCAQSVVYQGLKPVFIDANPSTWNIDVNLIEQAITKKTKAIMVVHIYGLPSDMDPIINLAKKYNLKIIEDAAESHGQEYKGKKCGGFGDISTFSFYPNKHITTGEGGMIMTSDEKLFEKCSSLKNLCFTKNRFVHEELGWNYRMSNLQAAVGVAQFERLESFIEKKKQMGALYQELLKDIPAQLPQAKTDYATNHYWVFGILLNKDVKFDAKAAMENLAKDGIGTRPFFYPMHLQPALKKLGLTDSIKRPISENLYERGFYIPSGLNLTNEQIETVVKQVKKLF